jgi:beta-glucanase (GH16 family)
MLMLRHGRVVVLIAIWSMIALFRPAMAADAPALDLSNYELSFSEDFDSASIVADGGNGRWFAPVHAPFGSAKFLPPSDDGPFSVRDGMLTIRAENKDGEWRSGLIQSVDSHGRGFAQQYGYFEMRAKLPVGAATWPAFWLLTQNSYLAPGSARGEIDVMEVYGDQPDVVHTSVHLRRNGEPHWFLSRQFKIPGLSQDFHRYGVLVDPEWVVFYVDGSEIYRFPTLKEYQTPFYLVVDLGMTDKTLAKAASPSDMVVDYVHVYKPKN